MKDYNKNVSVIICCAGAGSRLGIPTAKSLIDIKGQPLIIRLLEQLEEFDDIRVVVGYRAEEVINVVSNHRKDIMFVFNYDYKSNGPAASVSKAMNYSKENLLIIDGDIVLKDNLNKLLECEENCVAYSDTVISEPVYVDVNESEMITRFTGDKTRYEWTGIAKIKRKDLEKREDFVYKMINPLLPLKGIKIEYRGIDTQDDYENVAEWLEK